MRKGAESISRPIGARGSRRGRRNAAVWLAPRAPGATASASMQTPAALIPTITGAFALNHARVVERETSASGVRRCALIVDRDPELAESLAHALQARFERRQCVRLIHGSRLLGAVFHAPATNIVVVDTSPTDDDAAACFRWLRAAPDTEDIEAIFITSSATSYQLSQLGADGGVVLRQPHSLDDIASFVGEALAED